MREVVRRVRVGLVAEHAVILPEHLFAAILHRREEEFVGEQDGAVGCELDACGCAVDRVDHRLARGEFGLLFLKGDLELAVEHGRVAVVGSRDGG